MHVAGPVEHARNRGVGLLPRRVNGANETIERVPNPGTSCRLVGVDVSAIGVMRPLMGVVDMAYLDSSSDFRIRSRTRPIAARLA